MSLKAMNDMNQRHYEALLRMRVQGKEEEAVRKSYRLKDNDNVQVLRVPKAAVAKYGSGFVWQSMSMKAQQLQQNKYIMKGKITSTEYSNLPPKEKAQKLARLRCQMKYLDTKLNAEIAASPKCGVILLEDEA